MTQAQAQKPIDEIRNTLLRMQAQFEMALPKGVSVDKFIRVAVTALQNTPALMECERTSIYSAAMMCAQDGLMPDGREAALVKFNAKNGPPRARYMPMVQGILKKIRNSGELGSISAHVVRVGEQFDYWVDEKGEHVKHIPSFDGEGGIRLVYARATMKDGASYIEVMSLKQIEQVRSVSRAKDSGDNPWSAWWDEMAKKSAIRRLAKRLPSSSDLDIVTRDDDMYDLEGKDAAETAAQPTRPTRTAALLSATAGGEPMDGQPAVVERVVQGEVVSESKRPKNTAAKAEAKTEGKAGGVKTEGPAGDSRPTPPDEADIPI
jgi:recombination protein RecT